MWVRADLKMRGKGAFRNNYWPSVIVAFVLAAVNGTMIQRISEQTNTSEYSSSSYDAEFLAMALIITAIAGIIGIILWLFDILVGNVLKVGGCRFFIENQTGTPSAAKLGFGFKSGNYGNIVIIMFLRGLFTMLWTCLLVVPGIIKSYEYCMIPYILAENPGMSHRDAFAISKKMMMGRKWDTFVLDLSFIGWRLLEAITFGIVGIFYVEPYYQATFSEVYAANRSIAYQNGYIR